MRFGTPQPRSFSPMAPIRWGMFLLLVMLLLMFLISRGKWFAGPGGQQPWIDTRLAAQEDHPGPGGVRIGMAEPEPEPVQGQEPGRFFPGVEPRLLAQVRDNTVFRPAEHEAFFHLLHLAGQHAPEELLPYAVQGVGFVQLFRQPSQYRGQVVRLRGRARQVVWQQAPLNQYGIRRYARVVLQLYDHPSDPLVVFALELPGGFPSGPEVDEPVEVVGFFYKRWAYLARDTVRTAPLVLAGTLRWTPGPPAAPSTPWWKMLAISSAVALVLAAVSVVVMWRTLPARYRPRAAITPQEQKQIEEHLTALAAAEDSHTDRSQSDSSPKG